MVNDRLMCQWMVERVSRSLGRPATIAVLGAFLFCEAQARVAAGEESLAPAAGLGTFEMTEQRSRIVEVSGVIVAGGVECPLLRLDSGERFALQGLRTTDAPVGARVTVRGLPVRMSTCQQGPAFQVIEHVK